LLKKLPQSLPKLKRLPRKESPKRNDAVSHIDIYYFASPKRRVRKIYQSTDTFLLLDIYFYSSLIGVSMVTDTLNMIFKIAQESTY